MGFPIEIPDDMIPDAEGVTREMIEEGVVFLSTVDDMKLNQIGERIPEYEAAQARRDRMLKIVSFYAGLGLRLVPLL